MYPVALSPLLLAACSRIPEGAPETLVFETEHVAYYSDELPCDTLVDWIELDRAEVSAWLGSERSEPVRYFNYGADADLSAVCGDTTWGCYLPPGDIVTNVWYHRELAARAWSEDLGDPPAFFEAGLAWMLGPWSAGGDSAVSHEVDLESEPEYPASAAAFVRHLVDSFGREAFLDFYASDGEESSFELQEAVAAWEALPDSDGGDTWMWLPECASERMAEGAPVVPEMSCANVTLDANHTGGFGAWRTLDVEEGETVHVALSTEVGARAAVMACDHYVRGEPSIGIAVEGGAELWATLEGGEHFLDLSEYEAAAPSGTSSFTVERTEFPMGATCETAGEVSVGASPLRFVGSTDTTGAWFAWLVAQSDLALALGGHSLQPFAGWGFAQLEAASLCSGACDDLVCESADWTIFVPEFDLAAGERVLLRLELAPSSPAGIDIAQR